MPFVGVLEFDVQFLKKKNALDRQSYLLLLGKNCIGQKLASAVTCFGKVTVQFSFITVTGCVVLVQKLGKVLVEGSWKVQKESPSSQALPLVPKQPLAGTGHHCNGDSIGSEDNVGSVTKVLSIACGAVWLGCS